MKITAFVSGSVLALSLILSPTQASAKDNKKQEIVTFAPYEYEDPYRPALQCLATQLSPAQRATSIGVAYFAERTGRESFASDDSFGKFLSQGSEDMLINALAETGMSAVEIGPVYRGLLDWTVPKLERSPLPMQIDLPDIVVSGSFSTMDFGSSNVKELSIFGIGGGSRTYNLRYTLNARATSMPSPGADVPGGKVLAHLALVKDVVGKEKKGGIASFFGGIYVNLNVNSQKRELIQFSQLSMMSRTAYGLVSDLYDITACEPHLAYGDYLVAGGVPAEKLETLDKK